MKMLTEEALIAPAVVNEVVKEMFEAQRAYNAAIRVLQEAEQKVGEASLRSNAAQSAWRDLPRSIEWPVVAP